MVHQGGYIPVQVPYASKNDRIALMNSELTPCLAAHSHFSTKCRIEKSYSYFFCTEILQLV